MQFVQPMRRYPRQIRRVSHSTPTITLDSEGTTVRRHSTPGTVLQTLQQRPVFTDRQQGRMEARMLARVGALLIGTLFATTAAIAQSTYRPEASGVVTASKAYIHDEPTNGTVRAAYLVKGDRFEITDHVDGFFEVAFTNEAQMSTWGYVRVADVEPSIIRRAKVRSKTAVLHDGPASEDEKRPYVVRGDVVDVIMESDVFPRLLVNYRKGKESTIGWIESSDLH